jgi:hypothetical protein
MVLNVICNANLVDWITPEIWWSVAIILGIIGLCVVGYFYEPSEDGPIVMLEALGVGICVAFWPIALFAAAVVGIAAAPILLGMYAKRLKSAYDQIKKEELEAMNDAERILKK